MSLTTIPTDTNIQPATGNRVRVARYRVKHQRIDYAPSKDALDAIAHWRSRYPTKPVRWIIDQLLMRGHQSITGAQSGNGGERNPATRSGA